jgi:hypothetical protein
LSIASHEFLCACSILYQHRCQNFNFSQASDSFTGERHVVETYHLETTLNLFMLTYRSLPTMNTSMKFTFAPKFLYSVCLSISRPARPHFLALTQASDCQQSREKQVSNLPNSETFPTRIMYSVYSD